MSHGRPAPLPYEFLPAVPTMAVTSDDLEDGAGLPLPQVMRGRGLPGEDRSPHLRWSGEPPQTASFAITCYDPDAPTGSGAWHWIVYDIPRAVHEIPAGAGSVGGVGLPDGSRQGVNDAGGRHYLGAAPPHGAHHRYVFAVHALDVPTLVVPPDATSAMTRFACVAHTIARGLITATFERP